MKLSVYERLTLAGLYPPERKGSFATYKLIEGIKDKLLPDAKESKELDLKQEGQNIMWTPKKDKGKEIEFNELELELLRKDLREMDEKEELTEKFISVYKKVCTI